MVFILLLCVMYRTQKKQGYLPYTVLTDWFCIIDAEVVYKWKAPNLYIKGHVLSLMGQPHYLRSRSVSLGFSPTELPNP